MLSGLTTSDDATVGRGIERAAGRIGPRGPDIVVMTISAYTDDDQPPPLTKWIMKYLGNALFVVAAGNNGSPRPAFPPPFPV